MIINLSPLRNDKSLTIVKRGDVLTINGEDFDFSRIGEGDTLPVDAINPEVFDGPVERSEGHLIVTIFLPNPVNYSPEQAYPVPLENVADGPVALPGPLPVEPSE